MVVAMVQVRPVFVSVLARFVFMPVRMILLFCAVFVGVVVMAFIMPVTMLVGNCRVPMDMGVLVAEKNQKRNYNN